jgi:V/A-type H+/Na+-transporting ATPase subunit I
VIVPMMKAFAASHERDRDALLLRLRELGVLHIVPVHPADAPVNGEDRGERLRRAESALQVLRAFEPHGPRPQLTGAEVTDEVLAIVQRGEHARVTLDALYREAEHQRRWGGVSVAQLRALRKAGLDLRVLVVPERALPHLRARFLQALEPVSHHQWLVGAIGLDETSLSPRVEEVALPRRDRAEILAEASRIESELDGCRTRLSELAWLRGELERKRERLAGEDQWQKVARSGLTEDNLFAVQGWLPAERAVTLAEDLRRTSVAVAVRISEPAPDDRPPTLIRYRRWARPVDKLFRALNMVPGYRELDASSLFMIAIPLFAGMIIGDAGYGLLFLLAPLLARRFGHPLERDTRVLVSVIGLAALAWGALAGVWFGVTPARMAAAAGGVGALGSALDALQVLRGTEADVRMTLIKICFVVGSAHLVSAHLRRLLGLVPDSRALAEAGWCIVLGAMLGVIWLLFFGPGDMPAAAGWWAGTGLVAGMALVAGFSEPRGSLPRRLGLGLATNLFPFLNTLSDTLSYIRLMAVGLASYYLGSTFNLLAATVAGSSSWLFGVPVLLAGHALNIGLILIAIFAHGVRLNLLEFSTNAGIHWTGYAYRPFSDHLARETQ